MFTRLGDILSAATELLVANTRLAWVRVERLGARLVAMAALVVLAGASFCAALAGLGVLLAPEIGVGWAIIGVAGGTLLVSLIGVAILAAPFYSSSAERTPREQAEDAHARLHHLLPGTPDPEPAERPVEGAAPPTPEHRTAQASLLDAFAKVATSPDALAGAAFAVVSVLGVKRSVRLARTVAGAAGTGIAVARAIRQVEQAAHAARAATNGHHPQHPSRHEHAPETTPHRSA